MLPCMKPKAARLMDCATTPHSTSGIDRPAVVSGCKGRPSLFSALPYLKTGKLVALAVAGQKRLSSWPDLPTFSELGLQDLDLTQWYGLFAPARTPQTVVSGLNVALNHVLTDSETVARLLSDGVQVQTSSPQQLEQHVVSELKHWAMVLEGFRMTELVDPAL